MRLILDRIETNAKGKKIAVFEQDEGFIDICEDFMPKELVEQLTPGIIIEAVLENNKILSADLLLEETNAKRNKMKSRLNRLFNKNK